MPVNREAVKELRRRENLPQRELASLLGITQSAISQIESGYKKTAVDRIDQFYYLARRYGHNDLDFYLPPSEKTAR